MKLSERAMLTSLHISTWSGMALDRDVTDRAHADFKAEKDAGRYNKRLVAKKFTQGISAAHSNARRLHRLHTLPWEDDGTRVLATVGFDKYTERMREARLNIEKEVKLFLSDFPSCIEDAKGRLGKMFNEKDYPEVDELKHKFDFDVEIKPMPEADDFRAKVSDASMTSIIKDIERRSNERLEKAMQDIFQRVSEAIGRMSERLREYQPAKGGDRSQGVFRDTVVYNIHELAKDILPALNITNDPRVDELCKHMLGDLTEHSPEILRTDSKIRAQTISKADKLLKKVNQYLK